MFHYLASGLPNVWLENGYREGVNADGTGWFQIDHVRELHAAIGKALIDKGSLLTGEEFRFLRTELRLTRRALAHILGCSDETLKKWENGENPLSKSNDVMLRVLFGESLDQHGHLRGLLDRINHLERRAVELRLKEQNGGWTADFSQATG